MTKQEAISILQKFEKVVTEEFALDIYDINQDCTIKGGNVRRLVACVHEALPWPDEIAGDKEILLLGALKDVAANCHPCDVDHVGPALKKYERIMGGESPSPRSGNAV